MSRSLPTQAEKFLRAHPNIRVKYWRLCNPRRQLANQLKERYGLTIDDYDVMLIAQGGVCAICHQMPETRNRRTKNFSIDHDHKTGQIRGLLCSECNLALYEFKDSPDLMRNAANYLEEKCQLAAQ